MFAVAAWLHPRAELTGKKDSNGYATAAHSGEESNLRRFRFWNDLKWRMFTPNMDWWFGWPVFASSLLAVVLATFAWRMDHLLGPISAAAVYVTVTQVAAARRRNSSLGAPCPGTRVGPVTSAAEHLLSAGWRALAGATGGAVLGFGLLYVPFVQLGAIDRALIVTGGALIAVMPWWSDISLAHWREIVAARKEWEPRWEMLKQSPAPYLLSRDHIGEVQVDTFDAPAASGAIAFYPMGPKLIPTIGTNTRLYVLPTEDLDEDDQPITGTKHPLRFRVVTMTADGMPDLTDPELPEDQARIALECGVVGTLMEMGAAAPIIGTIKSVVDTSEPDLTFEEDEEDGDDDEQEGLPGGSSAGRPAASPGAAWMVQIMVPQGPPLKWMHNDAEGAISGALGCEVVVDWRTYESMFVGVLRHPDQRFADITGAAPAGKRAKDLATNIHRMDVEEEWRGRWEGVLKTNVNFPAIEHDQYFEYPLADGTIIYSQSFVTLKGDDLSQYFGTEAKLATALEHMPFVAVTGFLTRGQRRGERHPQAFTVLWSNGNLPANPEKLRPGRKEGGSQAVAEMSLLKGRVNEGFKAARLAQPEVFDAKCMTGPRSRGQIWKISIRLYGGVTLADVRGAAQRIKQSWGCSWLRVTEPPNGDGVVIVAGVEPARSTPADETVLPYLVGLDWEQAWLDAKISGVGGLTPKLRNVETLPDNDIVQVLDFDLPSGLALSDVRSAKFKLQSTTSNAFIEIRPHPDKNPSRIQVYAAVESPMPALAKFNFDLIDSEKKLFFATGIEGKPIALDFKENPHTLVQGGSGSGKTVSAQGLMYGAFISGADVVMIDVQKQGADFKFAEKQCAAFVTELEDAEACIKYVYAEVKRRARLNSQYGASHSSELPEDVRPRPIVMFIDEFLGLIMSGKRPSNQPEDNAELEKQRLAKVKEYNARKQIGFLTGRIAAEARSADVHLALMTQKLTSSALDDDLRDLKVNMARIVIGKTTFGDRMSALRDAENAPDLGEVVPKGRGIWESVVDAPVQVQFWYASGSDYEAELHKRIPEAPFRFDLSEHYVAADPSSSAVFGERIEPTSTPIIRPTTEVDLGTLDFDLSGADEEEVDLSSRGIQIIGLDDEDDADTVKQTDESEDLDWGDLSAAPVAEDLDWGEPAPTEPVSTETAAPEPEAGFDWSEPEPDAVDNVINADSADTDAGVLDMEVAELPHVDDDGSMYGWGLLDALVEHLSANPHIRTVRWHDEVLLSPFADSGLSYAQMLAEVVESLDVTFDGPVAAEAAEVPEKEDITWGETQSEQLSHTDQFEPEPSERTPFGAAVQPATSEPEPTPVREPPVAQGPAGAPETASQAPPVSVDTDDRPMRTPATAPDQFSDF